LSADHVIPESKGGPTTLENLQTLCMRCNLKKGVKQPSLPTTDGSTPRRRPSPDEGQAVENTLPGMALSHGLDGSVPSTGHPARTTKKDLDLGQDLELDKDVRPSIPIEPVQNPSEPMDWLALVPRPVVDDMTRYLLAKHASKSVIWSRLLTQPRDRGLLKRLYADAPGPLRDALQQAAYDLEAINNAGAWLSHTVRAIAEELAS
jgi:hypothetical protein